jgi:hypothetical protein
MSTLSRVVRQLWLSLSGSVRKRSRPGANSCIVDYEKVGLVWRPYVMRLNRPNQKTVSVATDSLGFRVAYYRGKVLPFTAYRLRSDASVLLGNSVAFGVGASSDQCALSNQLALITDRPWVNLSGRASNLMQDVLSLLLFGAPENHDIVLMSGINDLLFALHFEHATPHLPMFWGNDHFATLNESGVSGWSDDSQKSPVEARYELALEGVDRSLLLFARYGCKHHSRILFALQPLLAWTEKPLHASEEAMCAEWDATASGFRVTHRLEIIGPWKRRFTDDVRALCEKHRLDFIDLNAQPAMLTAEHLFADRIHLTDRGQQLVAGLIADRLQTTRVERR